MGIILSTGAMGIGEIHGRNLQGFIGNSNNLGGFSCLNIEQAFKLSRPAPRRFRLQLRVFRL